MQKVVDNGAIGLTKNLEAGKRLVGKLKAKKDMKLAEVEELRNEKSQ